MVSCYVCVIRVLANGVCTSRRFQNREVKCHFGCEQLDDLLHFWNCHIVSTAVDNSSKPLNWDRNISIRVTNKSLQFEALLFCTRQINVVIDTRMALMVEAIVHSHNQLRNSGVRDDPGGQGEKGGRDCIDHVTHLLHERILSSCHLSAFLAKAINGGRQ